MCKPCTEKTDDDNQSEFSAEVSQSVKQNFYVDDLLKSSATEEEAIQMMRDLIALCQKGGFMLEKWISNSCVVLQAVAEEHRAKDLKELDLDRDKLPVERKVYSNVWKLTFRFKLELNSSLSPNMICCHLHDLLGFLAPVTLLAKMIQQELCRRGCGWNDALPQDILQRWQRWLDDLDLLAAFSVERCIKPGERSDMPNCIIKPMPAKVDMEL